MNVEREVKLAVTPAFRLPSLDAGMDGVQAVAQPRLELDATYYDTDDLTLARAGVTLRHRTGEPGPPWTLKLPGASGRDVVERPELSFPGGSSRIPPAAADLIRASVRGRRLIPVARLHTARDSVEIRASDGTTLAELVDDAVTVWVGRRVTGRFREIEIEAKAGSAAAADVLRAVHKRVLRAAGGDARMGKPLPKLVRALGPRAARPADVAVLELGAHPTAAELVHNAIAGSVGQLLRRDPLVRLGDDEEGVHKFRVATRRLRSDLETFADHLDEAQATSVLGDLRWLGGEVGRLRDKQVLTSNMKRAIQALPIEDQPLAAPLLVRLQAETGEARRSMLVVLRTRRYTRLLDDLVALCASSRTPRRRTRGGDPTDSSALKAAARRRWRRLADTVRDLGPNPPDAALHAVRIKAKRCRYAVEALVPEAGKDAQRLAGAVSALQTVLGEHQDTVVAETWLREAAISTPAAALVAGELIAVQRAERARLRAEWPAAWKAASRKRLRAWM